MRAHLGEIHYHTGEITLYVRLKELLPFDQWPVAAKWIGS